MTLQKILYSKKKSFARYLLQLGLFFCLFIYQPKAYAATTSGNVHQSSIFDQLKQVPGKNRLDSAYILYRLNYRRAPVVVAMENLDRLSAIATELDDKSMQCAVFDMHADYYSVNNGYNQVSTDYYQKAINFARDNDMPLETGIAQNNKGVYLFIYKQYAEACKYFLASQETFKDIGYENVPKISVYLLHVVDFYYTLGDYDNAMLNLEDALKYTHENGREKINIVNTIGLIYRNYRQLPQAINYFNKALNIALVSRDPVWVGIIKGNIGSVYFLQHQYAKALPFINIDYYTSIKYNEPGNAALAMLRRVSINIDDKNFTAADKQLDTVKQLLNDTKEDVLKSWADYNNLESQLYEQLNKPSVSLYYRKAYEQDKDSLIKRNDVDAVQRVKLRYETDKYNAQLTRSLANEKVHAIKIDAVIAVLGLLMVISLLLYNRQRLARKKDKELMIAEKRIVDEQLSSARNALHDFTENLRQKNLLIENFKSEIEKLNKQSAGKANAMHLENLLHAHIMTDQNWNDFKKLFSKVYPGFFVNLSKNHPQLSAADTRLLALVKLGLNNSEMADMLGITVEGIKKAKQRLRKKIDIQAVNDTGNLADI